MKRLQNKVNKSRKTLFEHVKQKTFNSYQIEQKYFFIIKQ